ILIIVLLFFNNNGFAQDTTKAIDTLKFKKKADTITVQKFIFSENKYSYLNQINPDTIARKRFLWYPLKNFDDIFNYLPGYYLKYMDVGQINQLTFNQLDNYNTGVLRNGRPINDLIDGSIDLNLLSRNEISEMELTNGYGNSVYNYPNLVNVIERQHFQRRPYTELAFWQDRYTNEFLDAYFSQNFADWINFNFGITKHSYDGKYKNSDFDKWLGRFHLNLAPSKSLNFFIYTYYSRIQRGLNEGINPDTVDITNKEIMFNPTTAVVKNSDAYEIKERFDIDAGAVFQKGISFTKLQSYVSNSFRKYRDEENRLNPNGIFIKDNMHWINYGAKLQQIFNFRLAKDFNIVSRSEIEYDDIIKNIDNIILDYSIHSFSRDKKITFIENGELNYKNFLIGGYVNGYHYTNLNSITFYGGINGAYSVQLDSLTRFRISALYNSRKQYTSAGLSVSFPKSFISANYYSFEYYTRGINAAGNILFHQLDFGFNYSHCFNIEKTGDIFPVNSGNVSLAYHNTAIKNKLEYKIGLVSRFWSDYFSVNYSGPSNTFYTPPRNAVHIPANATLDFYIIGKIDKATFGLTFENILDRLIYNTSVHPNIDRGGLANVLSRFNITWYFFD
ncbi:MAG TPA: Plug domain-containing protein, partial [Ignavibacteria bacterium]